MTLRMNCLRSLVACAVLAAPVRAAGQSSQTTATPTVQAFAIADNSFLVEEAFDQEKGIFQSIFGWTRNRSGAWEGSFTQEWPLSGMTHQFSYTLPFAGGDTSAHLGGVLINYRFQALREQANRPAFSPRISVILPTGRSVDASDRPGLQLNLPFSKQLRDVYVHWNAGFTWLHAVPRSQTTSADETTPHVAASLIWRTRPLFHLMLESVAALDESVTISPGFRRA